MWHLPSARTRLTPKPPRSSLPRRASRPRLEALERRTVLSTVFDSVLGVGNDTVGILPRDNAVDAAGNTYVTGILYGTMDLDPAVTRADGSDVLTPRGTHDVFVAKYAPDNSLIWARRMGGDHVHVTNNDPYEGGKGIVVDGSGNIYVTGDFVGQADFGGVNLTGAGGEDAFVAKLGSSGNVVWAKRWGGSGRDLGDAISIDAAGNVVSVGSTAKLYADGSFTPNGFEVHKYSPTGVATWTYRIDNPGGARSVATDSAGDVYVGGEYFGATDFNMDPRKTSIVTGSATGGNGFVLKLNAAGAFLWVAPFIAKTSEAANSRGSVSELAVDGSGNLVVGGTYKGQVDINPGSSIDRRLPTLSSTADGFVAELTPAGALTWATPLGGASISDLALDASGRVYVTGNFSGDFTPGNGLPVTTSNGQEDVFAAGLTASGAVDWAMAIGGAGIDMGTAIAVDPFGTIYLAGTYRYSVDFDPDPSITHDLNNAAFADMYLLKLKRR
jgi:hypothetical protein